VITPLRPWESSAWSSSADAREALTSSTTCTDCSFTFGLALIIQGCSATNMALPEIPYAMPQELSGGRNSASCSLPKLRAWVILASIVVLPCDVVRIEKTRLGAYLRAATENPQLVQAFGINVPRMITLTYGSGRPRRVRGRDGGADLPSQSAHGSDLIIVVFAVVVIGGMARSWARS